ncbi:Gfo/Idh/MocA family oxidoreductase [Gammaproteobacteria bacterium]|nr:Gfo/Idh/MocA family oxidoreductase [Gammaproteobacteria bacterium]
MEKALINYALIGGRGIGSVHARILKKNKIYISSILGSSRKSSNLITNNLNQIHKMDAKPFHNIDDLLESTSVNAASLCVPNEKHFFYLKKLLNHKINILCEKPLFWNSNKSKKDFLDDLEFLKEHKNRSLFVNTSSKFYISQIKKYEAIKTFEFNFHTNGSNTYSDIGVDLIPHGFAMLLELVGRGKISRFEKIINKTQFSASFFYNDVKVRFFFSNKKNQKKVFSFKINEDFYERILSVDSSNCVNFFLESNVFEDNLAIKDPFEIMIEGFLSYCKDRNVNKHDSFEDDEFIMLNMIENLV